jgi:hypothetical protein
LRPGPVSSDKRRLQLFDNFKLSGRGWFILLIVLFETVCDFLLDSGNNNSNALPELVVSDASMHFDGHRNKNVSYCKDQPSNRCNIACLTETRHAPSCFCFARPLCGFFFFFTFLRLLGVASSLVLFAWCLCSSMIVVLWLLRYPLFLQRPMDWTDKRVPWQHVMLNALTFKEVCALSCVCKALRVAGSSSTVWKSFCEEVRET